MSSLACHPKHESARFWSMLVVYRFAGLESTCAVAGFLPVLRAFAPADLLLFFLTGGLAATPAPSALDPVAACPARLVCGLPLLWDAASGPGADIGPGATFVSAIILFNPGSKRLSTSLATVV